MIILIMVERATTLLVMLTDITYIFEDVEDREDRTTAEDIIQPC